MLCTLHYFAKDYLFAELYSAVYLLHLWLDAWTRPQSWAALPSQRSGQKEQKEFECQREGEPKDKRNESHEGQSADTLRTLCQHCKHDPKCSACVIICSPKASSDSFCLSCVPTKSFVYVCVFIWCTRTIKAHWLGQHSTPVLCLTLDPSSLNLPQAVPPGKVRHTQLHQAWKICWSFGIVIRHVPFLRLSF